MPLYVVLSRVCQLWYIVTPFIRQQMFWGQYNRQNTRMSAILVIYYSLPFACRRHLPCLFPLFCLHHAIARSPYVTATGATIGLFALHLCCHFVPLLCHAAAYRHYVAIITPLRQPIYP